MLNPEVKKNKDLQAEIKQLREINSELEEEINARWTNYWTEHRVSVLSHREGFQEVMFALWYRVLLMTF